jgi:hypothetical protein
MHAEQAYLFRHALLRDTAYQLQVPADRHRLHALALEVLEQLLAVPGHELELDSAAAELAVHARLARGGVADAHLQQREATHLRRAARFASQRYMNHEAAAHWLTLANLDDLRPTKSSTATSALSRPRTPRVRWRNPWRWRPR